MADEEVSVGDLVVGLSGDGDKLDKEIESSIALFDRLEKQIQAVGRAIDEVNARQIVQLPANPRTRPTPPPAPVAAPVATPPIPPPVPAQQQAALTAAQQTAAAASTASQTNAAITAGVSARPASPLTAAAAPAALPPATLPVVPRVVRPIVLQPVPQPVILEPTTAAPQPNYATRTGFDPARDTFTARADYGERRERPANPIPEEPEGGGGGGNGGRGGNAYAGRRIASRLGQAVGMTGLAGDASLAFTLAPMIGVPLAAGAVAALAIGTALMAAHEKAKALREESVNFALESAAASRHFGDLAHALLDITEAGKQFSEEMSQARESAIQTTQEFLKAQRTQSIGDKFTEGVNRLTTNSDDNPLNAPTPFLDKFDPFGEDSPAKGTDKYGRTIGTELNNRETEEMQNRLKTNLLEENARASQKYRDQERAAKVKDNQDSAKLAIAASKASAIPTGPIKESFLLQNQIAADHLKLVQKNAETERAMNDRHEQERKAAETVNNSQAAFYDPSIRINMKELGDRQSGETTARKADAQTSLDVNAAEAAGKQAAFREEQKALQIADANSLSNALIAVHATGYARDLALLNEANAQQHAAYVRAGRSTVTIDAEAAAKVQAQANEHHHQIFESYHDLQDRLQNATSFGATAVTNTWNKMARDMGYSLSYTKEQLKQFHEKFLEVAQAEAIKPLLLGAKQSQIDIDLALHKITELEAARKHALLANPELAQTKAGRQAIDNATQQDEHKKNIAFAHDQLANINNLRGMSLQMQDYARSVRAAVKSHDLSTGDAAILLEQKAHDIGLTKKIDTGSFGTQWGQGGASAGGAGGFIDLDKVDRDVSLADISTGTVDGKGGDRRNTKADALLNDQVGDTKPGKAGTPDGDRSVFVEIRDILGKILVKEGLH